MPNRRPKLEIVSSSVSPDEAAAIAAAVEQFLRDRAPVLVADAPATNPWKRAALLEGVGYEPDGRAPWGDPHPWG